MKNLLTPVLILIALVLNARVLAQVCTVDQAKFVSPFVAAIRPGKTEIPSMELITAAYEQPAGYANPQFEVTVPFSTNIVFFVAYEKQECDLSCAYLPDGLASTNKSLEDADRPTTFAYDVLNTCEPSKLAASPYYASNQWFTVKYDHPDKVLFIEIPQSLQYKVSLKKQDGTPVYKQDKSIKDQLTLSSTSFVGMIIPQGYMQQDGVVRRYFTVERTETYELGIETVEHETQFKVFDTNSETDDKNNLIASMTIQAPDTHYLDKCTVTQSDFGDLDLFNVRPTPKQPIYSVKLHTLEPSATGYYGSATFDCEVTVCLTPGQCTKNDKKSEFKVSINQRVPASFNFTTAVTAGQFDAYQGGKGTEFSTLVNAFTNSFSLASVGFTPEREFTDYKVSVVKASLCTGDGKCNVIVQNDAVVANDFTKDVDLQYFNTDVMQSKYHFKVNSFGFSFNYEPYRKFNTDWRFVISYVMKPVSRVHVTRSLLQDINDDAVQKGFFNFKLKSKETAAPPPEPQPEQPNWLLWALGITVAVLGVALIAAFITIAALLITKLRRGNYHNV